MAQYSISINEVKQQMKLKVFTPALEEEDVKFTVADDEMVFICAPYFLRIKPSHKLVPGDYFPKYDSEKFVFEYKIKLQDESVKSEQHIKHDVVEHKFAYGFNSSFRDNLDLMRDELKQIGGIANPDELSPAKRRERRQEDESQSFKVDHYKHDYWFVLLVDDNQFLIKDDISLDFKLTISDKRQIDELIKKPLVSQEIMDNTKINFGLIDILFSVAYDWRVNASEINEASSAWTRATLSATLSYFDEFESLEDVFRSFYRRVFIYPLYRSKCLVRCCIIDVCNGLETYGQSWILKQLVTNYSLFNLNNYCILNRYYIAEYIKYVYRFVTDEDAVQMAIMLRYFHLADFNDANFGLNLEKIDKEVMQEMFNDNVAESDDSDDDSSDSEPEDELTNKLKELKV